MDDRGTAGGGGEFVALHPEAAEDLAAAMRRAGDEAVDLLERVRRALADGDAAARGAVQALDDAGVWGEQASADLRWRIEAMVALDRSYLTPGRMVSGVLPFASQAAYDLAIRAAWDGLDGVLADPALAGDAAARATAVALWAARLPPGVLDAMAPEAPALLGNLDGIPLATRYAINARRVETELARVERLLSGPLDAGTWAALKQRREALERLAGPAPGGSARQLLAFDPAGDGRAVEVYGDLAAADHVAIVVPGIQNTLDNFHHTADSAVRLYDQAQFLAPIGQQVATIAWLGYDTPGYVDAVSTVTARGAAPDLQAFVDGQRLDDGVHTTLMAHSYGSVVAGHALAGGLQVDDAVMLGSPGVGVDAAGDIRPEGGDLYAIRTADDPVSMSQFHGPDPAGEDFGASVLASNAPGYAEIGGHSSYFAIDSVSLDNLANITVDADHRLIGNTEAFDDPVHFSLEGRLARDLESSVITVDEQLERLLPDAVAEADDEASYRLLEEANDEAEATIDSVTGTLRSAGQELQNMGDAFQQGWDEGVDDVTDYLFGAPDQPPPPTSAPQDSP